MHAENERLVRKVRACQVALRLCAVDEKHELLRFILREEDEQVQREFRERFGIPNTTDQARKTNRGMAYAYIQYQLALRRACRNPQEKIVVNHIPVRIIQFCCHRTWLLADVVLAWAATETFLYGYSGSGGYFPGAAYGLLAIAVLLRKFGDWIYRIAF